MKTPPKGSINIKKKSFLLLCLTVILSFVIFRYGTCWVYSKINWEVILNSIYLTDEYEKRILWKDHRINLWKSFFWIGCVLLSKILIWIIFYIMWKEIKKILKYVRVYLPEKTNEENQT
jgi:hypothetical protein